jgi:SAM-dependent methyltransferase
MNIYNRIPNNEKNGIPIFSDSDEYTSNYDKISNDHLAYLEKTGENPFMPEEYWKGLEKETIEHIEPLLFEGAKVLDVGVGLGRLLSGIKTPIEKYGVDISLSYLLKAKNSNINVCLSKIEELPYKDNYFDFVISTDVLEHVFDLNGCINQIIRVLKPNGICLIRVPNEEDLTQYLDYEEYKYVHVRNFSDAGLRLLFEKVFSCEIISSRKIGLIKMERLLSRGLSNVKDNLSFFENLMFYFRLGLLENSTLNEYFSRVSNDYNKHNFKLKNGFLFRQLIKICFWFFKKAFKMNLNEEDYYNKVELSIIIRKKL